MEKIHKLDADGVLIENNDIDRVDVVVDEASPSEGEPAVIVDKTVTITEKPAEVLKKKKKHEHWI